MKRRGTLVARLRNSRRVGGGVGGCRTGLRLCGLLPRRGSLIPAALAPLRTPAKDYLKLSVTQARRLEMDSQVRVLELESEISRERERLGQLRRAHYHVAEA